MSTLRRRLGRVLDHVYLDGPPSARAVIDELHSLVAEAEERRLGELVENARDALAEAWRWSRGEDAVDARCRVASLARRIWLDSIPMRG